MRMRFVQNPVQKNCKPGLLRVRTLAMGPEYVDAFTIGGQLL